MNNLNSPQDFSKNILEKIKACNTTPRPRWYFILHEGGIWVLGIATTFLGALMVSATLFVIVTAPLRFESATHESIIRFWIDFLPLLWITLFVCFIFATDFFIKKTKRGYRYNLVLLTVSSVLLSVIIGYLGFLIGLGEFIEDKVTPKIPFQNSVHMKVQKMWVNPEKGLLSGVITVGTSSAFVLQTENKNWNLNLDTLTDVQKSFFEEGALVHVIGTTTRESDFVVCMVVPLKNMSTPKSFFDLERKTEASRINICKGVRPYERLQTKLMKYETQ